MDNPFTAEVFEKLGLKLDETASRELGEKAFQTLQDRIGASITELLEPEKADELAELSKTADDQALQEWLEAHVPDYEEVVQDEVDLLIEEIVARGDVQ